MACPQLASRLHRATKRPSDCLSCIRPHHMAVEGKGRKVRGDEHFITTAFSTNTWEKVGSQRTCKKHLHNLQIKCTQGWQSSLYHVSWYQISAKLQYELATTSVQHLISLLSIRSCLEFPRLSTSPGCPPLAPVLALAAPEQAVLLWAAQQLGVESEHLDNQGCFRPTTWVILTSAMDEV